MKLVVDASVAVAAAATPFGSERLRAVELATPPLLWIEADSALHAATWRGELRANQATEMRQRLPQALISKANPKRLADEASSVADEMGWAKTYDANYVALARIMGCRLVTVDARLRRGTARLGFVVGPRSCSGRLVCPWRARYQPRWRRVSDSRLLFGLGRWRPASG